VRTLLDTGWPSAGWTDALRAELRSTLTHVDVFLPNLDEARGLLALPDAAPSEPWPSSASSSLDAPCSSWVRAALPNSRAARC
jgi:sugar/nucleoside kinase (ribokinase family)